MNDLLQIQNKMGLPEGERRSNSTDDESQYDEVGEGQSEWLGVPVDYRLYHPDYTTSHWLSVFRAIEASA